MTQEALKRIRYGADPELFLARNAATKPPSKSDGKMAKTQYTLVPVPITGLVGGTKEVPLDLTNKLPGFEGLRFPKGAKVQEDGAALEFNTAPAPTAERMLEDISIIVDCVKIFAERKGMLVMNKPSADFSPEYQRTHPQAFRVGCDPDFNAYTGEVRVPPPDLGTSLTRHAGGHFHIGYNKDLVPANIVVQFLDVFLGLPSILRDKQGTRRRFYGQAGSYREKDYGVEYRTLSNFWLPGMSLGIGDAMCLFTGVETFMRTLISNMQSLEHLYRVLPWSDIRGAINEEDPVAAMALLRFGYKVNKDLFYDPLRFAGRMEEYQRRQEKVA